jgi:hypothetical protein
MIRSLALLTALVCAAPIFAQTAPAERKPPALREDLPLLMAGSIDMFTPGVAEVRAISSDGDETRTKTGVGFFIGPGELVTSRRLLMGADEASFVMDTGDEIAIDRVIAEDVKAGLVLAKADVPPNLRRGLRLSFLEPLIGDDAIVAGRAEDPGAEIPSHELAGVKLAESISEGGVKLIRLKPFKGEVDREVWRTLEGAPVIDTYGQVVGVTHLGFSSAERPMLAVAVKHVHKMTKTGGLTLADWSEAGSLSDVIEKEQAEAIAAASADKPRPEGFPPPPEEIEGYKVIPSKIVERAEGGYILDDRFPLVGAGTKDDPYTISWDLLVSGSETMMPRLGKKSVPERLAMLDGQWVRISGNISLPLMMNEPTELLMMLNPWDGCCIGVPPTPYDAIEVGLERALTGDEIYVTYGSVKGRFHVKPYLVGDWLVGMYVMDGASVEIDEFKGVSP